MRRLLLLVLAGLLSGCPQLSGRPQTLTFESVQVPAMEPYAACAPQGDRLVIVSAGGSSPNLKVSTSDESGQDWSQVQEVASGLPEGNFAEYELQLLTLKNKLLFLCKFTSQEDLSAALATGGDAVPYVRAALSEQGLEWSEGGKTPAVGLLGANVLEGGAASGDFVRAIGRFAGLRLPLYSSNDGGQTWTTSELLLPPIPGQAVAAPPDPTDRPALTVDNEGRLHLMLSNYEAGGQTGCLYLRSSDAQKFDLIEFLPGLVPKWGAAIGQNQKRPELLRLRAVALKSGEYSLTTESSNNGGKTWSAPGTMETSTGLKDHLRIEANGGLHVMTWQEHRPGAEGLYCCTSTSNGSLWSAPYKIAELGTSYSLNVLEDRIVFAGHPRNGAEVGPFFLVLAKRM